MDRSSRTRTAVGAAGVAAGLTLAAALVAMAGRYPLGRAAPVDAASARTPLTILVFGVGLVGLAALILVLWPMRRRRGDDPGEIADDAWQIRWWWKLLAIVVPLALGAALVAAVVVGAGGRHAPLQAGGGAGGFGGLALRASHRNGPNAFALPAWLPWTVLAIVVAGVAAAVAVVLVRGRRLGDGDAEPAERGPAASAAVDAALHALDPGGDPRAAVIAAYAAMERALAVRGVARRPAEAPREFLRRVLAGGRASGRPAATLTDLFEEARFSTHPIGEPVRARARSALDSLRAALTAGEAG